MECQYKNGTNDTECIKCEEDYYMSNGICNKCNYQTNSMAGGTCYNYYCPGGKYNKTNYCNCNSGYINTTQNKCISCPSHCRSCYYDQSSNLAKCRACDSGYKIIDQSICISCPSHCNSCNYDQNANLTYCIACNIGYAITNQYTCISCPSYCNSCGYDGNTNSTRCFSCNSRYALSTNNECISCGEGCSSCVLRNGEIMCSKCDYNYALNGTTYKCQHCPSYCTYCHIDETNRFICDNCELDYVLNETKLCEICSSNDEIGGEGCIHCKYENRVNKCTDCRNEYLLR